MMNKKLLNDLTECLKPLFLLTKDQASFLKAAIIANMKNVLKRFGSACPCTHLDEPCKPNCTCKNSLSSAGCDCCCSYGSEEQRKEMAKHLVNTIKNKFVNKINQ